ncbi:MurR/RpiR family transcriptional regulator [Patescibacteria group bacterium]|nr:MurR/RpiR family transcriptional regulator [Patescibacteria group bacterium]
MGRFQSSNKFSPELSCTARIFTLTPHFTQADHAIADLAINHPQLVATCSARELGRHSNVSEASVIRFVQKLEYESLKDFREALKKELVNSQTAGNPMISNQPNSPVEALSQVVALCSQALQMLTTSIDINELGRAAKALENSSCIHFFAAGGSIRVAQHAAFKLLRLGYPSFAQSEPFSQIAQASTVQSGSVAFGISFTGSTKSVVDALAVAKENGATVICLTNFAGTQVTELSDICLITPSPGGILAANSAQTRVAQFAILDVLLNLITPRCEYSGQ